MTSRKSSGPSFKRRMKEVPNRDTSSLDELLRDKLGANEAIASTRTTIVLHTSKDTTRLPIKKVSRLKPGEGGKA